MQGGPELFGGPQMVGNVCVSILNDGPNKNIYRDSLKSFKKKKKHFIILKKKEKKRKTCEEYSDQIPSKICLQLEHHFNTVIKKLSPSLVQPKTFQSI